MSDFLTTKIIGKRRTTTWLRDQSVLKLEDPAGEAAVGTSCAEAVVYVDPPLITGDYDDDIDD